MSNKTFPIIGTKSSLLWDEETDAWVYMSGAPMRKESPQIYYGIIPTLYRAVDLRANSIAGLPWELRRGKTVVDSSEEYQNVAGLVTNMYTMLYLIEASLVLAGRAYWKREKNPAGYNKLRHLEPNSLELDEAAAIKGEIIWRRNANGTTVTHTPKEIIYFWYPDPYVELGPPAAWPVKSALNACGVLANVDEFAKTYFARGAIKATLFAMQGAPKNEADRFESWWSKFVGGIKNANTTKVVNADKVTPIVVGEGIKELEKVTLTQEKREEIALATSVPMSILFANAANYATAERDKLNWYEDKIVPEANWIAAVLNEQVFDAMGLRLEFKPETLDIFQEDEEQRAMAMSHFMDALTKASTFEMAQALFLIYGVDVPDEAMSYIEQHYQRKAEEAERMQSVMQPETPGEAPQDDNPAPEPVQPATRGVDLQQLQRELSLWQSKCIKAVRKGGGALDVAFIPVAIPGDVYERILAGLGTANDEDAVKSVFASALHEPEPELDPIMLVLQELKRANDLLSVEVAS